MSNKRGGGRLTWKGSTVRNLRLHLDKFDAELEIETFALTKQAAIELHFNFLDLGGDQVRRHIRQVLLYLLHLGNAEAGLVGLIVHFEILDLLKAFGGRPSDSLIALRFSSRGILQLLLTR